VVTRTPASDPIRRPSGTFFYLRTCPPIVYGLICLGALVGAAALYRISGTSEPALDIRIVKSPDKITIKKGNDSRKSGDIFRAVAFEREQLFDAVAVVSLQFNGIAFDRPPARKFAFHVF